MAEQLEGTAVRRSIEVAVPPERAFAVFTDGIGSWWPLDRYTIGSGPAETAVVEPREGGRWYERAADGTECDWGRVLAWEPPHRLVLSWEISADWQPSPGLASEVEVRFTGESGGARTRVELEHRGLEAFGDRAEEMHATFSSPHGWGTLLGAFAAGAER
jgi:uncharacterized protein YndB with AHSA1/START domain